MESELAAVQGELAAKSAAHQRLEGRFREAQSRLDALAQEQRASVARWVWLRVQKTGHAPFLHTKPTRPNTSLDGISKPPTQHHRRLAANRAVQFVTSQLQQKEKQPDPMDQRPQLESQREQAVSRYHEALLELLQTTRARWEGARERGVLELAQREADMQVGRWSWRWSWHVGVQDWLEVMTGKGLGR
jgi:hypothetical protein